MSNKLHTSNPIDMYKIGNATKNAVQSFENGIVQEHNYLEKVNSSLKSRKQKNKN